MATGGWLLLLMMMTTTTMMMMTSARLPGECNDIVTRNRLPGGDTFETIYVGYKQRPVKVKCYFSYPDSWTVCVKICL